MEISSMSFLPFYQELTNSKKKANHYRSTPSIHQQLWWDVTNRTGVFAVANLPILWVFSGRNDVFLWLTSWDFATFNSFHRWVARIMTVEAIVHSIGYTYLYVIGKLGVLLFGRHRLMIS